MFVARYCDLLNVDISCDGCDEIAPWHRYRCLQCNDMDLCKTCFLGKNPLKKPPLELCSWRQSSFFKLHTIKWKTFLLNILETLGFPFPNLTVNLKLRNPLSTKVFREFLTSCSTGGVKPEGHEDDHEMVNMEYACDHCQGVIIGRRMNCNVCDDFDLCYGCYSAKKYSDRY